MRFGFGTRSNVTETQGERVNFRERISTSVLTAVLSDVILNPVGQRSGQSG